MQYQLKARVCDFLLVNNTNLTSYLAPFPSIRVALVKVSLRRRGVGLRIPLFNAFVQRELLNLTMWNFESRNETSLYRAV